MTQLAARVAPPLPRHRRLLRAVPAAVCALAAVGALLWGRSYPGFPMAVAGVAVVSALAAVALTLLPGPQGRRRVAALVTVTVVLGAGIVADHVIGDRLLHERWALSRAAFESEVATLPAPLTYRDDDQAFRAYPGACPSALGKLTLSECWTIDGGYLFLQAPNALTDSSGIAYLPGRDRPETSTLGSDGFTPLGGPWWSWTCDC